MPYMPSIAEQAEVMARARDLQKQLSPGFLAAVDDAVLQATSLEDLLERLQEVMRKRTLERLADDV